MTGHLSPIRVSVVPAKAGTHGRSDRSTRRSKERRPWIDQPYGLLNGASAFAGMTIKIETGERHA